ATVAPVSPGGGIPGGTVTFVVNDGSGPVSTMVTLDSNGVGTLPTPLNVGTYTITANYDGSTDYTASSGNTISQTVTQANATVAPVTTTPNPAVFGQPVTFTTTVSAVPPGGGTPTGTVLFFDNGTQVASGTLDGMGVATSNPVVLSGGSHSITA